MILILKNILSYKIYIIYILKFINKNQLILYLFNIYFKDKKPQIYNL